MPAKFSLLGYEFTQVILLASITASLTRFLLLEQDDGLISLDEVMAAEGLICFSQDVYKIAFLNAYPRVPESKCQTLFQYEGLDEEAGKDCIALIENDASVKISQSRGEMCSWVNRQRSTSTAYFGATNPAVHEALMEAYNIYKHNGYFTADLDTALRTSTSGSICNNNEVVFESLNIAPFGGLFILTISVTFLSTIYTCFYGFPDGLQNHHFDAFMTYNEPGADYVYEVSKKTKFKSSEN